MSSYEPNSAVVVLYESKEYKILDKKTSGLLSSICGLKSIDNKDNGEVTITFPSSKDKVSSPPATVATVASP